MKNPKRKKSITMYINNNKWEMLSQLGHDQNQYCNPIKQLSKKLMIIIIFVLWLYGLASREIVRLFASYFKVLFNLVNEYVNMNSILTEIDMTIKMVKKCQKYGEKMSFSQQKIFSANIIIYY